MSTALLENNQDICSSEDDVRQYLQEIRQYPRLTPEQEKELAKRCADGDEEAIKAMVNSNLRLVVSVAREYVGRGAPLLDMIQEGSIGLLAAARKFDHTLDYRFSTYATKWIRQGVSRCVMEHAGLIRVPRHTADRIKKLLRAKRELQKLEGCDPSLEQIAQYSGIPADKAAELLRLMPEVCSLDAPAGEDDGTLQLLLENMHSPQPQEELVRQEMKRLLESLLGLLPDRQQQVLRLRFGMEDGQCHTLEQIGVRLGVSKERARQIEHQAVEKLQKLGAGLGLEDFLE